MIAHERLSKIFLTEKRKYKNVKMSKILNMLEEVPAISGTLRDVRVDLAPLKGSHESAYLDNVKTEPILAHDRIVLLSTW
jgi:hypothetical protein